MLEFDVRRSGDGVLVAHHDERLGDGRLLCDVTAADVAGSDPNQPGPPQLKDLMGVVARHTSVLLDLKEDGIEEEALAVTLAAVPEDDVLVTTLSWRQVAVVKAVRPRVRTGLSVNRSLTAYLRGLGHARHAGADLLAINHLYLRTPLARAALSAGLPLYVWTVDSDRLLERVVQDPRIACVITNRPLRAQALSRDASR